MNEHVSLQKYCSSVDTDFEIIYTLPKSFSKLAGMVNHGV